MKLSPLMPKMAVVVGADLSEASKRHLARLHTLNCVVCLNCYGLHIRAVEAHHLESVRGEHSDFAAVPLCHECHSRLHQDRRRAFHVAHKTTDIKLLAWTLRELVA